MKRSREIVTLHCLTLFVLAVSLGIVSCATIINGPQEEVTITATPSDAEISVDGITIGKGPIKCSLDRNKNHDVDVTREGYRSVHIRTGISSPLFSNVIDQMSGAAYNIVPNPIIVVLSPGSGEPMVQSYDTNGQWDTSLPSLLPALVIVGALVAFTVWVALALGHGPTF